MVAGCAAVRFGGSPHTGPNIPRPGGFFRTAWATGMPDADRLLFPRSPAIPKEGLLDPVRDVRVRRVNEIKQPIIRVLVAEDYPVVADGIVAVLTRANDIVVVGQARDGAEAIDLIKRHRPDIVLLDLRMPVVDGLSVARWMKGSGSTSRVIILTSFQSERDVNQAIQAGAKGYLLKDTPGKEILKTIRRVHKGGYCISPEVAQKLAPNMKYPGLTPLELEILGLILQGDDNRTIGTRLGLGREAVKYHLRGLFSRLGVRRRAAAVRQAIDRGFVRIDNGQ